MEAFVVYITEEIFEFSMESTVNFFANRRWGLVGCRGTAGLSYNAGVQWSAIGFAELTP